MKKAHIFNMLPLVQIVVMAACGTDSPQRVLAPSTPFDAQSNRANNATDDGNARFSDWTAPTNVGQPVNSSFVDQGPAISKDGLSLYFQCNCPGGFGGIDIWVSRRPSVDEAWGAPQNLGPSINTTATESGASVSTDGHTLYFTSNRPGGFGGTDLYIARRHDKRDDLGWESPVNLGSALNTQFSEGAPQPFEDEATGIVTLYLNSDRPGGAGQGDIYVSERLSDGSFAQPLLVGELSSAFTDQGLAIRKDGLEVIFSSNRPGTIGLLDLWVSTRATTVDSWSTPTHLGPVLNSEFPDAGADFSFDGTALYFHSALRPGGVGTSFDIWVATREKQRGAKP